MRRFSVPALLCAFLLFSFPPDRATAQEESAAGQPAPPPSGNLLVAPTRVVFEGRTRTAEVVLHNTGTSETTYRISLVHLRMSETGEYRELDASAPSIEGEQFADELLRYSPRQVMLKPGESQTVKIMVRKPETLADGEYRSHMLFRAEPPASADADVEAQALKDGQIAVRLIPLFGISIPVIVRHGNLSATAGIENVGISGNTLHLTLTRSGNASVYGDVIATSGGPAEVAAQSRGVAVLLPNATRTLAIPFDKTRLHGPLRVEYRAREEDGGKTLAQTEVNLH